jgi:DMSO reductase anchor subunit
MTEPLFTISDTLPIDMSLLVGLLGTVIAFALYVCTAMIYASLKFLQEWHTPLTVANYTFLGLASGFMLAAALAAYLGIDLVGFYGTWAVVATVLGLITRTASLIRNRRIKLKINLQTAIGVRHGKIAQKAQGAMGGSFNTREFFHGKSEATLGFIRVLFLLCVFVIPMLLIGLAYTLHSPSLPLAAFAVQYLGLLAERWYFFAESTHPQNLYYQTIS